MKWIGKVTGALIGSFLGPVGTVLGLLLGHQYDESGEERPAPLSHEDLTDLGERFFRATFRIMGRLAKADGRVSESEISAARMVMSELRLNAAQTRAAIECFGQGKQPRFDFERELRALHEACRGRADLPRVFLEIQMRAALAGNNLDGAVRPMMLRVAQLLDISGFEFAHVEAVLRIRSGAFRASAAAGPGERRDALAEAYSVLETAPGASDAEVTKAYRRALNRHHPDKLKANGLPDSMIEHAKQRTQQIIEAWELVRTQRGMR